MHSNSGRTLVFVLILALVISPVIPVLTAYANHIASENLRHLTSVSCNHTSVQQGQCVDLCDSQCCASCANCFAASVAELPNTPYFAVVLGSTVAVLKSSLATALHTGPPRIPA